MDPWEKKSKTLTQALIVSGALNIAFIGTLIAFSLKSAPVGEMISQIKDNHLISSEVVALYLPLNFEQLIEKLNAKAVVEDGYLERDIALGILVEFHHFNLERALSGVVFEKREVMFTHSEGGEEVHFSLFPGLSDGHFEALVHYAETEKWPLTTLGLFLEIKGGGRSPSLLESFRLSKEVDELIALFHSDEVMNMLLEGDYQALSLPRKDPFDVLSRYLQLGSKTAAQLFFREEGEFLFKRLDNGSLLRCLSLVEEVSPDIERGLSSILNSPRPDEIRKEAARLLSRSTGAPVEMHCRDEIKHVVVSGDTLWEIAKKYRRSIDQICEANHLEKGKVLKVNQEIVIPR
ncbi:MAG: LysM peptidoglycan-binding domain-containing protein [Simkaniaceae bacterium]|nr:LysM peptidoglycan-binding domain-containing protein [Simkaniaceae bacterium]